MERNSLTNRTALSLDNIMQLYGLNDGEPAGTRTQDPVIKSHVLYRLSYALAGQGDTEIRRALPALRAFLCCLC